MSVPVILSSPTSAPPEAVGLDGLQMWWEFGGVTWDLLDFAGGIMATRDGLEGLHQPKLTKYRSRSRAIPGNRIRGWQAEARDVFWPLRIWADGSEAWRQKQNAFFSSLRPDEPGIWRVRAGNIERTLSLTAVFDESHAYQMDPYQRGWGVYGIALEASQPYWVGPTVRRGPWRAPDPQPFFPPGGGPSFTISSSRSFATATIPNPGDVEAWARWTAIGPLTSLHLGVAGAVIDVPFDVPADAVLVIDTDPRRPSATLDGVDATADLGLQQYASVPRGSEVELTIEASGAGQVSCELQPLHFRAF